MKTQLPICSHYMQGCLHPTKHYIGALFSWSCMGLLMMHIKVGVIGLFRAFYCHGLAIGVLFGHKDSPFACLPNLVDWYVDWRLIKVVAFNLETWHYAWTSPRMCLPKFWCECCRPLFIEGPYLLGLSPMAYQKFSFFLWLRSTWHTQLVCYCFLSRVALII